MRQRGTVRRCFPYTPNVQCDTWIVCDASPWDYGAVLVTGGQPVACMADTVSREDVRLWGLEIGNCKIQAKVEAMCILIAVRAWYSRWAGGPLRLGIKPDSMAAFGAVHNLR